MYNGINGNGRVVVRNVAEEQKAEMLKNPAYKFVRWIPVAKKINSPAEVEDVVKPTVLNTDGDSNSNDSTSSRSKRRKS